MLLLVMVLLVMALLLLLLLLLTGCSISRGIRRHGRGPPLASQGCLFIRRKDINLCFAMNGTAIIGVAAVVCAVVPFPIGGVDCLVPQVVATHGSLPLLLQSVLLVINREEMVLKMM